MQPYNVALQAHSNLQFGLVLLLTSDLTADVKSIN